MNAHQQPPRPQYMITTNQLSSPWHSFISAKRAVEIPYALLMKNEIKLKSNFNKKKRNLSVRGVDYLQGVI